MATKHWLIWDVLKKAFVEDKRIEVEEIDVTNQFFSKKIFMSLFSDKKIRHKLKLCIFIVFFLEGERVIKFQNDAKLMTDKTRIPYILTY